MLPQTETARDTYVNPTGLLPLALVYFVEILSWPILVSIRLLIVRNELYRDLASLDLSKYEPDANFVLYSNHQSKLDSFLITACLPTRAIWKLLPFRFFVLNTYLRGYQKSLIYLMGGFPALYEEKLAYGLDCARVLMKSGQTIVIFPQGKRTRERVAKPGVARLAAEPNTYLIPAHIDWKHRWLCRVHIGSPIKGGSQSHEELMDIVYNLPTVRA